MFRVQKHYKHLVGVSGIAGVWRECWFNHQQETLPGGPLTGGGLSWPHGYFLRFG